MMMASPPLNYIQRWVLQAIPEQEMPYYTIYKYMFIYPSQPNLNPSESYPNFEF